ncbi:MAG TPA: prepilin-type N-terminal cleavage/methylation domain-containing protein [Burkholderiaceae bacterium]|nr:prepilin-type N-terminal cleavage/methylation domain-containing protein [Burkholderiaceae bacterium]
MRRRARTGRGFTLIELLLVVALIAVASAVATLALRDPAASRLEQEAARLTALLESARGEARALGLPVTWQPVSKDGADAQGAGADFRFTGLPPSNSLPTHWLDRDVTAEIIGAQALVLGPEPIIGAQRVTLSLDAQRITLATDGLGPFAVVGDTSAQASQ